MAPSAVTLGSWCQYCSSPPKKLCKDPKCQDCHEKSFASSPRVLNWSLSNNISPRDVFKHSAGNYLFDCHECGHEFRAMLNNISKDTWCGFCNNLRLCDSEQCEICPEKSFASHPRAKFWSKKNKKTPRQVTKSTATKYWFVCDKDKEHIFDVALYHVTCDGRWCPFCKNKTEDKLFKWLIPQYLTTHPGKFNWCINPSTKKQLIYDFYLPDYDIIIELDGAQHFRQISNWTSPEDTQRRDRTKERLALRNNLTVNRLHQEDVLLDENSWQDILERSITRSREAPTITHLYEGIEEDIEYIYELRFVET